MLRSPLVGAASAAEFVGAGLASALTAGLGAGFTASGAPEAAESPGGVAVGGAAIGAAGCGFGAEAASPLIAVCRVGRFVAYQKTTSAIAIRTMAAMATPGRLRRRKSPSSCLSAARGMVAAGVAVRAVTGAAAGAAEERAGTGAFAAGAAASGLVTAGALHTRRHPAKEPMLPA